MRTNLEPRLTRTKRCEMRAPALVYNESQWKALSLKEQYLPERDSKKDDRQKMETQSKGLKASWTNTLESQIREKADMIEEVQKRLKQDIVDIETLGKETKLSESSVILKRAKELAFQEREEIRQFKGALMTGDAATQWETQEKERKMRESIQKRHDLKYYEIAAKKAQEEELKENEIRARRLLEGRAVGEELRKHLKGSLVDLEHIRKEGRRIREYNKKLTATIAAEHRTREDEKEALKRTLDEDVEKRMDHQKTVDEEKAFNGLVRKEYVREKVKTIEKMVQFQREKREKAQSGYPPAIRNVREAEQEIESKMNDVVQKVQEDLDRKEEAKQKKSQEKKEKLIQDGIVDRIRSKNVRDNEKAEWENASKKHKDIIARQIAEFDSKESMNRHKRREVCLGLTDYWKDQSKLPKQRIKDDFDERTKYIQDQEQKFQTRQAEAAEYIEQTISEQQSRGANVKALECSRSHLLKPPNLRKVTQQVSF